MNTDNRLPLALLFLRVGVFIVMFFWALDKFVKPEHAAAVFQKFYFIGGLGGGAMSVIGGVEMVILAGFILGYQKRLTYGAVLVLHGISTLASFKLYLSPFANLVFFAAWPMLAACFALYALRDHDTLMTVGKK